MLKTGTALLGGVMCDALVPMIAAFFLRVSEAVLLQLCRMSQKSSFLVLEA